ncbi:MAG: CinA family protein [Microbacteriaceae bacterium]
MSDVSDGALVELAALLDRLAADGETIAVAESLTGGLVCSTLVAVPGASRVVTGGIVAYQTDIKATVLGVSESLLAERGAVDPDVALAMARAVRSKFGATIGLATTGVAGPDPQDGVSVGTVFVALVSDRDDIVEKFEFDGSRDDIRHLAVGGVLQLLENSLRTE